MLPIQADGARFQRQCQFHRPYKKRYLLVCQLCSPLRFAHNSQTSNLYCHPSLQDCVRASLPQTCGRPHASLAHASGSRTYKGKRSRDCVRLRLPQTLAGQSPLAPQGENNHPGEGVPVRASLPRIRRHNIIPSELCNSRRHRQCHASRESVKHTPGARKNVLQGV